MTLRQRAHSAHMNGHIKMAKELYRELLDTECIAEDVGNLGSLLSDENKLDEAITLYEKYLTIWPNNYQLLFNAANTYIKLRIFDKAIHLLKLTIKLKPQALQPVLKLSNLLLHLKNNQQAINLLEQFCKKNSKQGLAWLELGATYYKFKLIPKALEAFNYGSKVLPDHCGLIANRLTLSKELKQFDQAIEIYESLSLNQKANVHIKGAWAGILLKMESIEEAKIILKELTELKPHEASYWIDLAACEKAHHNNLSCQKKLKKGLIFNPNNETLKQFLAQSLSESGEIKKALQLLDLERQDWDKVPDEHIFNVQFIGAASTIIDSKILLNITKSWEKEKEKNGIGPIWQDTIRENIGNRKIRIAYLSADFSNHPVSRFLLPILKNHNKEKVDIIGLHCGYKQDGITELVATQCNQWINLAQVDDMTIARLICDHKIDAVIELGGFTGGSRLSALIHKPAPIQLSYLGYFAPTYLSCIDGWIGDEELFGGLSNIDKQEKLIKIHGGYMAYEPVRLPKIEKLKSKKISFGSFNNSRKLNNKCINFFSKLIKSIPNSQIVIKSITFLEAEEKERIYQSFIKSGLKDDQIILLDWIEGTKAHMELYKWIDIGLDTFPYGGATTTAEALWMGVPVITLAGKGMVGRLSSSILKSAGCEEWIAQDLKDYENIAKSLALKGQREVERRNELRHKISQSNLANGKRVSSQIEDQIMQKLNLLGLN